MTELRVVSDGVATPAAARPPVGVGAWLQAGVLTTLVVIAYHRTFAGLWDTWMSNDNYSHGPLVPPAVAALIWLRWDRLRALPIRPTSWGIPLVAFACAMHLFGVRADLFALQGWSLLPLALGLSLVCFGVRVTRMLAFPIGYLGFMMTFPPIVMNKLSYALKDIAVELAARAAEISGARFERDGMSILLATGELRVENPCSGLRSLVALLGTATLFAYFQSGGPWRRWAVALAAVPIAILGNAARLWLLILVSHHRSVEFATGAFHDWTGYVLYGVALGLLYGLRALLSRRAPVPSTGREVAA